VRTRLALGYAAAVGVALLLYAGAVSLFYRASLHERLDDRLHEDYEAAEHEFERTADGGVRWTKPGSDPDAVSEEAPWVEVSRPGGPVLLRRPEALDPAAGPWRTREWVHETGGEAFTVRVGRSEAAVRREMRGLLWIFAAGLVPAVGLAWLAGLVLARRALAPVDAMTERARTLTAERLAERLPVENPDDELGRLASTLNDLVARLEAAFGRLRAFTADASHELRAPLTAMRVVGEVGLREGRDPAVYRDVVGSMLEEVDRLTRLVDGLLVLARGDAGRTRVDRRPTDLSALARDVASQLGVLAEERGQTLSVEDDGPLVRDVDAALLRRALSNLVDNAIRHGPERGRVVVSVSRRGGDAVLAVSDDGPPIPDEHRARLFERFWRADPARGRGGAGLGLSIARAAVEAHGGALELAGSAGPGNTFRIVLPGGVPRA
jgi:heavy metal sensor kinase